MKGREVGTAVIGCGSWGRNHVRNFADLSDLRLCCDPDRDRLDALASTHPGVETTTDLDRVLDDPEVAAVSVATPANTHAELAVRALEAGKHVLVEKPLALTVADAEQVVETADRTGRTLMVGHVMEYHPGVVKMKELVEAGELGETYYLYSQRVNLGAVRSDENALWSLAPHDLSMMNWLLEEEPEEVDAHGASYLRADIEDVVFLYLQYPSGAVGHVHVSWLDPHKERELTVVGDRRMAVFDDMEPTEKVRVYDKGADLERGRPDGRTAAEVYLRDGDVVIPALEGAEPLAREVGEFLRCVAEGDTPRSDGRDGLRVVRTLARAERALKEGAPETARRREPEAGGTG